MIGRRGIALLKQVEGCSPIRYQDQAGKWTIGIGHLIRDGETFTEPLTEAQIETLLQHDLGEAEALIARWITVKLNESQHDAMLVFLFNVGTQGMVSKANGSTNIRNAVNEGRWQDVPMYLCAFSFYHDAQGQLQPSRGMLKRRCLEAALYLEDRPNG